MVTNYKQLSAVCKKLLSFLFFTSVMSLHVKSFLIEQWGDGKYYKRFLLGSKKKLENEVEELESKLKEFSEMAAKRGY